MRWAARGPAIRRAQAAQFIITGQLYYRWLRFWERGEFLGGLRECLAQAAMMVGVRAWCALLALVVIACGASSDNRMSVTQPQELRGQVDEQPSLFGMPTYGRSLRGQIFWSTNRDDRTGCKPIQQTPNNPNHNPIVYMFERGGCTFVTKVRHAQDAGATAVIVKNDGDGPLPHMSNDGSGMSIVIPSMIIKKSAGDKITNWAEQHPDAFIEVSIEYGLPESDVVDYRLWTSSMDPQAFEFKLNFRDVAKALEKKARFDVRYFFVSGKSYGCKQLLPVRCTVHRLTVRQVTRATSVATSAPTAESTAPSTLITT